MESKVSDIKTYFLALFSELIGNQSKCSNCYAHLKEESREFEISQSFSFWFSVDFYRSICIIISAVLLGTPISAGIVLILGPLPIILGTEPYATLALVLAVLLAILNIVMFFMFNSRRKLDYN